MPSLVKWASIELLHNVKKSLERKNEVLNCGLPTVHYMPKVKLDGTNSAVQICEDESIIPQSHNALLIDSDNHGFAAWVKQNEDYFKTYIVQQKFMVIHGEWSGLGIQKRTAISKIDRKIFAVFAVQIGDFLITSPEEISRNLSPHKDIYILPYMDRVFTLDFSDSDKLKSVAEDINKLVLEVEACDPWVKETFGIEGIGEGVVMYPRYSGTQNWKHVIPRDMFADYAFKAKGEKHSVVKQKEPVIIDVEKVNSVNEFVSKFVTVRRLEQGLAEGCGGKLDMKLMGEFIKWISLDVKKESEDELEASKLEWKDVAKGVGDAARNWYKGKVSEL
jgi:hypothetical protein